MVRGFEIILQGECSDYCDKAIYRRRTRKRNKQPYIEISFPKQCEGQLIVKDFVG